MNFKVNANMSVKVKLTDFGISILKKQHEELNTHIKARGGKGFGEFELRLDEDGYYSTQIWMLMSKFGHVMSMTNEIPFYLDIIIQNGEPITE
jgi:methyl coenzyme M reductase gamma subunit